ncbi:helix-turn-helix domain-containing protein [Brevibacillus sp. AY1]|nr:helix-turn-helix domain-containing protein [Brevibacillus sp. AY1]
MGRYISVRDVMQVLGVSKSTVYQLCKSNVLPHTRLGGCIRFKEADIIQFMEENKQGR